MVESDQSLNVDRAEDLPLPGLLSRYLQVFVAPGLLFEKLRERPAWGGAMALGSAFLLAGTILVPAELLIEAIRQQLISQGQSAPAGLEGAAQLVRLGGAGAALVGWFIINFLLAGVVTFVFAFVIGDEGTYRQYLAVLVHAQLITATSTVLVLPLKIMAGDVQLLLSAGTFAFFLEDGYFFRFLSLLDLFGLWAWVLVGLGVAKVGGRAKWVPVAAGVLIIPVAIAAIVAIFNG